MVGAVEHQDPIPAGVVPGQRDGHQVGLGARIGEPDLFHRGETVAQQHRQSMLIVGHRAKRPAPIQCPADCVGDLRWIVAEQPGGVVTEEVGVAMTVDIDQSGPVRLGHPEWERIEVQDRSGRTGREYPSRGRGLGCAPGSLLGVASVGGGDRGGAGTIVGHRRRDHGGGGRRGAGAGSVDGLLTITDSLIGPVSHDRTPPASGDGSHRRWLRSRVAGRRRSSRRVAVGYSRRSMTGSTT